MKLQRLDNFLVCEFMFGLGLGILAALKKNKWQDQVINIFIILLISVPSIILGLMIHASFYRADDF